MPGQRLSEAAKHILLQVEQYLRKEAALGKPLVAFSNVSRRFKGLTGYDMSTVLNIKYAKKQNTKSKSVVRSAPTPAKPGPKPILDSFDRSLVRRAIHNMYTKNLPVSLPALQKCLFQQYQLDVTTSTLHRAVRRLGFRYQRGLKGKRFAKEDPSIVASRIR